MNEEKILEKAMQILKERKMVCECKRCGYVWFPRSFKPVYCPRCRARDYDNPKKREIWKCYRCGYEWQAKTDKPPRYCPNCHKREITRLEDYKNRILKRNAE